MDPVRTRIGACTTRARPDSSLFVQILVRYVVIQHLTGADLLFAPFPGVFDTQYDPASNALPSSINSSTLSRGHPFNGDRNRLRLNPSHFDGKFVPVHLSHEIVEDYNINLWT